MGSAIVIGAGARLGQAVAHRFARGGLPAVNVRRPDRRRAHRPGMARRGGGSILITGGPPDPDPRYPSLSLGKAGVRTLVTLLDRAYG